MFGFGWCSGMGAGGWLLMLAFWGAFLALVVWAVARVFPTGRADSTTAEEALARRFAAGEIDAEDYRRARHDLTRAR
jgi:putative membrane protein